MKAPSFRELAETQCCSFDRASAATVSFLTTASNGRHSFSNPRGDTRLLAVSLMAAAVLAACGGGGGNAPVEAAQPANKYSLSVSTVPVSISPQSHFTATAARVETPPDSASASKVGVAPAPYVDPPALTAATIKPVVASVPTSAPQDVAVAVALVPSDLATARAPVVATTLIPSLTQPTAAPATAPAPAPAAAVSSNPSLTPVSPQVPAPSATATPSKNRIVLRASATGPVDSPVAVALRINGRVVGTALIRSTTPADVAFDATAPTGGGVMELVFTNGGLSRVAPVRRLLVESITAAGVVFIPTDAGVYFDSGEGTDAFDAQNLLPGQSVMVQSGALRFTLPATTPTPAAGVAPAAGYYVDAKLGDDSGPGSVAQPWRTLARLNSVRLRNGEGIYLRCGSIWRASLTLDAIQLVDGATIAGYGAECSKVKATISGADDFTGSWTLSAGVWSRSLPAGTPKITQLFVEGLAMRTAQWPNVADGSATQEYARVNAVGTEQRRFTPAAADALVLNGRDMTGATLQLRTQPWLIETRKVNQLSNSTFELDRAVGWPILSGQSYVIQDKRWMLDAPGEFFHDVAAQKLYLIAPTAGTLADLNGALIEGSVRDIALDLSQRAQLVVRDLALKSARLEGIRLTNARGPFLSGLIAQDNGDAGVRIAQWASVPAGSAGPRVENSLASGNGQYGIDVNYVERASVLRNRVFATGNASHHQGNALAAIAAGPGAVVEDNVIDGTGYNGIHFSSLAGTSIGRNTISGYCSRLSDCGAIYTWSGRAQAQAAQNATVQSNRIFQSVDTVGAPMVAGREVVAGIYLDDMSRNIKVWDNLVYGATIGVLLHNASIVEVARNRIWLSSKGALAAMMDQYDANWLTGNSFHDNQIIPRVVARLQQGVPPSFDVSQAVLFQHNLLGVAGLGATHNAFSNNTVVQLQGPLQAHALIRSAQGDRLVDDVEWRSLTTTDIAPVRPLRFSPLNATLGDELVPDSSFAGGLSNWSYYNDASGSGFALQTLSAGGACSGPCVQLTSGHQGDLIASRAFQMRKDALHVYSWTAVMPVGNGATVGSPYVSRSTTPWDQMSNGYGFVGYLKRGGRGNERVAFETFFVAKDTALARINVQLETLRTPVIFTSASVREVRALEAAHVSDWSALAFAPTTQSRVLSCADLGWPASCSVTGIDGQAIALPLTLAAGTEKLLLRADSSYRRNLQ